MANINKFSPYHDTKFIEYVLKYDDPVSKYCLKVSNPDLLDKKFVLNNFNHSINSLKKREENLNIHISDFIKNNWRNQQLFFTINHPSLSILLIIIQRIMSHLGLEYEDINWKWEPLQTTVSPIYPYVLKQLSLTKPEKITQNKSTYTLEEYLRSQLEIYKTIRKETLHTALIHTQDKIKTPK